MLGLAQIGQALQLLQLVSDVLLVVWWRRERLSFSTGAQTLNNLGTNRRKLGGKARTGNSRQRYMDYQAFVGGKPALVSWHGYAGTLEGAQQSLT
jgi:hypothetical protein